MPDGFYRELDRMEQEGRLKRIFDSRPENLHDYQGCANDPTMSKPPSPTPPTACEYCGPVCYQGAAHNARVEDGAKWPTPPTETQEAEIPLGMRQAERVETSLELELDLSQEIRLELWVNHQCQGKYGDDGEMQCNCFYPMIDFKRDFPSEILAKSLLHRIQLSRAAVAPSPAPESQDGVSLIQAERRRQVEVEGWTPEHDDSHSTFEMTRAAVSYCFSVVNIYSVANWWPWDWKWWKPSPDPIRNLVKAGALIVAEIDRLQRKAGKQ